MIFEDWATLGRTLLIAPLAYLCLLIAVRASGKRALGKLNAFDLVVTVALGSVLASVAVSPSVTLASGAVAFAVLVGLQYVIAFLSTRLGWFQSVVKARPTLMVLDGELRPEAMDRQRVTRSEILQVLRQNGVASVEDAAAVVLETDGNFSVLQKGASASQTSTLADVAGWA